MCRECGAAQGENCLGAVREGLPRTLRSSNHRGRVMDAEGIIRMGSARPATKVDWASYADYLKSATWQALRKRALEVAEDRCQVCNSGGQLVAHHRTYDRVGGHERLADLTVLCANCHKLFHEVIPPGATLALKAMKTAKRRGNPRATRRRSYSQELRGFDDDELADEARYLAKSKAPDTRERLLLMDQELECRRADTVKPGPQEWTTPSTHSCTTPCG